ncbi:hypothetical protein K1720_03630 [Thermococcus argininiproducens]|uniref:Uncharacterized protein n=1 Tax=Thermococcus argininiproducens TaxID=2866384 RepID=A0A9E7SE16_9EURY|nr:hypothetical protein [Thermococcus argininiproducens]USH00553.1 hypothetical protein K1720_03630 [Thermococcus argininiproducens]
MKDLRVRGPYSVWKFREKRGNVWNIPSRTKEETCNTNKRFAIEKVKLAKIPGVFSLNKNKLGNIIIQKDFFTWFNVRGV